MEQRPGTSSGRPITSSGRPATSSGAFRGNRDNQQQPHSQQQQSQQHQQQQQQQYAQDTFSSFNGQSYGAYDYGAPSTGYGSSEFNHGVHYGDDAIYEEDEEEYEESDDGDVFAYLPPTTADLEAEDGGQSAAPSAPQTAESAGPFQFGAAGHANAPTYNYPPGYPALGTASTDYSVDAPPAAPPLHRTPSHPPSAVLPALTTTTSQPPFHPVSLSPTSPAPPYASTYPSPPQQSYVPGDSYRMRELSSPTNPTTSVSPSHPQTTTTTPAVSLPRTSPNPPSTGTTGGRVSITTRSGTDSRSREVHVTLPAGRVSPPSSDASGVIPSPSADLADIPLDSLNHHHHGGRARVDGTGAPIGGVEELYYDGTSSRRLDTGVTGISVGTDAASAPGGGGATGPRKRRRQKTASSLGAGSVDDTYDDYIYGDEDDGYPGGDDDDDWAAGRAKGAKAAAAAGDDEDEIDIGSPNHGHGPYNHRHHRRVSTAATRTTDDTTAHHHRLATANSNGGLSSGGMVNGSYVAGLPIAYGMDGSEMIDGEEDMLDEDSPYPEVRASVSNIDDPSMPVLTFRSWFLGIFLSLAGVGGNVYFNYRYPAPAIYPMVLLLVAHPLGKFMAYSLPIESWWLRIPGWLVKTWWKLSGWVTARYWRRVWTVRQEMRAGATAEGNGSGGGGKVAGSAASVSAAGESYPPGTGAWAAAKASLRKEEEALGPVEWEINLNPGPFNIKEHVIIYMMTNASVAPAYALNPTVVAEKYYGIQLGLGFNFLIVIGTQCIGLGIAGMCRRFLVWPASLIWPQNLVACTLLNTLHAEDDEPSSRGGITRHQMFMWGVVGAFVWSWFPSYIFQALSVFSWVCWWKPNNVVINQLFGVYSGLGMGVLSFDWNQIAFIGSPMMVPWWAVVQIFIGFVTIYWLVLPLLYYNDVWHFASFPMMANSPFDRFGAEYNISRVINTADHTFNQTAYDGYSPLYLPANYAMTYLLAFTLTTCIITHTLLYHGKDLMNGLKRMKMEEDDIHAKLMRYYPEVPDWWYGSIFFGSLILGLITLAAFNTGVPLWGLIVAILVPVIYIVPVGFVYAFTAQSVSTNLISESLAGLLFPGRPLTNMIFKAYATQTQIVGQYIVQDLKLGHYIKIPPRATFMAQGVAVFITAVAQVGIQHALFLGVKDICAPNQSAHLTCPHTQVFYSASVIWGLIGPTRQFGAHALYKPELYALAFGAVLPIPLWLWQKRYPRSILSDVSTPVILTGPSAIPPALGINYSSWFAVAVIFQYFVRRKNFRWWSKFNYILSSAMDSGTSIGAIVIFLTLQLPKGGNLAINWWGNNVFLNTLDGQNVAYKPGPF